VLAPFIGNMVFTFELARTIRADRDKVLSYFTRVEDLPRFHPEYVRAVNVISREGNRILFEQEAQIKGRRLRSKSQMIVLPDQGRIEVETLEGDGRGSKVTMMCMEVSGGTLLRFLGELRLGALEFLFKGVARSLAERTLDEDVRNIEAMPG
jgi:hypothetical protein